MTSVHPIERTLRLAGTFNHLTDAWAFVMARLDEVGPDPRITISPVTIINVQEMDAAENGEWPRQFEVTVEGMVKEDVE